MNILSSFTDWLFTDTSKTQTASQQQANIDRLNGILDSQGKPRPADGGNFLDPGAAADSAFLNSVSFGTFGDAGNQPDGGNSTGVGALLKDVLILAAIAGAIYLFVKLGGIEKLKRLAS